MKSLPAVLAIAAMSVCLPVWAQIPVAGPNVNMVSGTGWPGGDPFLQRQNEPSMAISTRNPSHLVAGANDYRTVDLAVALNTADPDAKVTGDAWLGLFKSFDNGRTWRSTLLPGCRYPIPECQGSPLSSSNYQAGADPLVRSGANGMFYYSAIAFDRNKSRSVYFVARLIDDNNRERIGDDTIRYLGTAIVDQGASGQFIDKPWIAVDIPRAGAPVCSIPASGNGPAQSFRGGAVYAAWSRFTGDNNSAQIFVARSVDCGATWSNPAKISAGSAKAQGATVAIDPVSGNVYVAWRRFMLDTTQLDSILISKSTDGGKTFSNPVTVSNIVPFDLGGTTFGFRNLSFPTMAVDQNSRIYVAWSARQTLGGDARVMLSTSTNGSSWSPPQLVETPQPLMDRSALSPVLIQPGLGHQLMPSMSIVNGRVAILYYSLYEDATAGELLCPPRSLCNSITQFQEFRRPAGNLLPAPPSTSQLGTVFGPGIADAGNPPLTRRHTMDVRIALSATGASPAFATTRVSQYLYGSPDSFSPTSKTIQQLRFNVPNLPLFVQGTQPFMGDYIDLAAQNIVPGLMAGSWTFNSSTAVKPKMHAVWTDNRDVVPPTDGDWTHYTPLPLNNYNVGPAFPACLPGQAGMRNQNVYTSYITEGVLVSSPGNNKQLNTVFARAFPVVVQNNTDQIRSYRLTIGSQPPGGRASFLQTALLTTLDATAAPRSSFARSVFVTSNNPHAQIPVNVVEITAPGGTVIAGGQQGSALLNPDLTNPDLTNPDLTNPNIQVAELYVPDLTNPDLTNPDLTNPDLTNPDLTNPDLTNPDLTNPDLTNPGQAAPDLTNPDLTNPDLTNPDLTNTDISAGTLTDATWKLTNRGNTTSIFVIKLVTALGQQSVPPGFKLQLLLTRSASIPSLSKTACELVELNKNVLVANIPNPVLINQGSPDLTNPDLTNPDLTNPTIAVAPGETVRVSLRIQAPTRQQAVTFATTIVQPNPVAQAVSTNLPPGSPPAAALIITTLAAPNATTGVAYSLQLQAVGGTGARTWSLTSGVLPTGMALDNATGVISGIASAAGTFNFRVRVVDSGTPQQSDDQDLTIVVSSVTPLVVNQTQPPGATVGQPFNFTPSATGGTLPYTWFFYGTVPSGLNVAPITGTISGTPTQAGNFGGYFIVQDSTVPPQYGLMPFVTLISSGGSLAFTTQPVNGTAGQTMPPVAVKLVDAVGSPVAGVQVTLSLDPNPGLATLAGTTTATTGATGIATFSNIHVANHGGWDLQLRASTNVVGAAISAKFHVAGAAQIGTLSAARDFGASALLPNGDILIAGGFAGGAGGSPVSTAELLRADPLGPSTITATGSLNIARMFHTMTVLPDGRVLVTGGQTATAAATNSAEIYNPVTGSFSSIGPMVSSRALHTATLLPNGKVLIAGGSNAANTTLATAELFDTVTGAFTSALTAMGSPRAGHKATLLGNGKVLLTGGATDAPASVYADAILYDPATDSFSAPIPMISPHLNHSATLLADGRVLLAGGTTTVLGTAAIPRAELYDPILNTFSMTAVMGVARSNHTATLLPSGKVLMAGGSVDVGVLSAFDELYNPATGTFTQTGSLGTRRRAHNAVLAKGVVAVVNGAAAVELYYPIDPPFQTPSYAATGNLNQRREGHLATRLANGKILLAGGYDITPTIVSLNSAELYDPATGNHTLTGNMLEPRANFTATLLGNGKVLVTGGYSFNPALSMNPPATIATAELYDPGSGAFTATGPMNVARQDHSATLLPNGKVLIVGGTNSSGTESSTELYDPATGVFTTGPVMSSVRTSHAAVLLPTGKVLIAGGHRGTPTDVVTTNQLYDPNAGPLGGIGPTGPLVAARSGTPAILLNTGKVLMVGGLGASGSPLISAELYDPIAGTFSATGSLHGAGNVGDRVLLFNGKVVVLGTPDEIYDPALGSFSFSSAVGAVNGGAFAALPNGKILRSGGLTGGGLPTASSQLFSPGR